MSSGKRISLKIDYENLLTIPITCDRIREIVDLSDGGCSYDEAEEEDYLE